jgi:hypothetical protein
MIGILAYGSLIADPGWEINNLIDRTIVKVETPFAVEYARQSKTRSGAPTLVPVPDEKGQPVQSCIFVLKPYTRIKNAKNIVLRREKHQIGNRNEKYIHSDNPGANKTTVAEIHKFKDVDLVLYTKIGSNLPAILDETITDQEKAELLARFAINSINERTFFTCQDGIHYLAAAMHFGVITRLTELYKQAILRLTNNSNDFAEARLWVAKKKGIIT